MSFGTVGSSNHAMIAGHAQLVGALYTVNLHDPPNYLSCKTDTQAGMGGASVALSYMLSSMEEQY